MPTRATALYDRESKTRNPAYGKPVEEARTAESTRAAIGDSKSAASRPLSLSAHNASNLTYTYLQGMRAAPLTSPVLDDIGSDIESSDDGDDFRVRRRDSGEGGRGGDAELDDDYIRRLRADQGKEPASERHGFGSSSPTKRLSAPAPPVDNPWVPSSGARARNSAALLQQQQQHHHHHHHRETSSDLVRELMHVASPVNSVVDLEAQIRDLRVQINRMSTQSPRAAARARARFDAEVARGEGGPGDSDGGGGAGGGGAGGGVNRRGSGDTHTEQSWASALDPNDPDFFASVRRDFDSPGAGGAGPDSTWAERVRRQASSSRREQEEGSRAAGVVVRSFHCIHFIAFISLHFIDLHSLICIH
jgi:hypothetical protein